MASGLGFRCSATARSAARPWHKSSGGRSSAAWKGRTALPADLECDDLTAPEAAGPKRGLALELEQMHENLPRVGIYGFQFGQAHVLDVLVLDDVRPIDVVYPLPARAARQSNVAWCSDQARTSRS